VGPRTSLDVVVKRKISSLPLLGMEPNATEYKPGTILLQHPVL